MNAALLFLFAQHNKLHANPNLPWYEKLAVELIVFATIAVAGGILSLLFGKKSPPADVDNSDRTD